jgi:hypothetical protein
VIIWDVSTDEALVAEAALDSIECWFEGDA